MFGSKKSAEPVAKSTSKSSGSGPGTTTLISTNTEINGDMEFSGSLVIEGKVNGNIAAVAGSDAHLRLLESGQVVGEIRVPTIIINGNVEGDVYSSDHIELAAKAHVDGNVHYNLIEMVKGSQVNGNLVYSKGSESSAPPKVQSPPAKPANKQPEPAQTDDLKSGSAKPINA